MFKEYLNELSKINKLSLEEERLLWESYKDGDDQTARISLIEHYQLLVFKEAQRFNHPNTDGMELVQEGTVGLIEAVERFNYNKGIAFSIYARHRIRGRILDYLRKEGKRDVLIAAIDENSEPWWESIPNSEVSTEVLIEEQTFQEQVKESIKELTPSEQFVMKEVCMNGNAVKNVASDMEISQSYIYRLQRQGIKKLKKIVSSLQKEWDEL